MEKIVLSEIHVHEDRINFEKVDHDQSAQATTSWTSEHMTRHNISCRTLLTIKRAISKLPLSCLHGVEFLHQSCGIDVVRVTASPSSQILKTFLTVARLNTCTSGFRKFTEYSVTEPRPTLVCRKHMQDTCTQSPFSIDWAIIVLSCQLVF
jgi:hypothetical protein